MIWKLLSRLRAPLLRSKRTVITGQNAHQRRSETAVRDPICCFCAAIVDQVKDMQGANDLKKRTTHWNGFKCWRRTSTWTLVKNSFKPARTRYGYAQTIFSVYGKQRFISYQRSKNILNHRYQKLIFIKSHKVRRTVII